MRWFERLAHRRADEAAARGELSGLPGEGRPLDPERLRETAEDVMHRLLAEAGGVPQEIALRRKVDAARAVLAELDDPEERRRAQTEIALLEMRADMARHARLRGRG